MKPLIFFLNIHFIIFRRLFGWWIPQFQLLSDLYDLKNIPVPLYFTDLQEPPRIPKDSLKNLKIPNWLPSKTAFSFTFHRIAEWIRPKCSIYNAVQLIIVPLVGGCRELTRAVGWKARKTLSSAPSRVKVFPVCTWQTMRIARGISGRW